jgi:UDP-N-acetylmuramate dehydrogenase
MEHLEVVYRGPYSRNESLKKLNSFGLGGRADWLFTPDSADQVGPLLTLLHEEEVPVTILGGGTNVLIRDGGIRGAVIQLGSKLDLLEWGGDDVRCGVGLTSSKLALRARDLGRVGFAWAAGLPGNLGGALCGNAGSFGGDIAGCFLAARGWSFSGEPVELKREDVEFGYRSSSITEVICEVTLSLPPVDPPEAEQMRESYQRNIARRVSTQPGRGFTAGSTFRNPSGDHAGRLIEACGLKGTTVGGATVSRKHANFIEATGESVSAEDVERLMELIAAEVKSGSGIELEREVRILGEHRG